MKIAFWKKILGIKKDPAPVAGAGVVAVDAGTPQSEKQPVLQGYASDIFFSPIMTEKANDQEKAGRYAFRVAANVNKPVFARAVSRRYGVSVVAVRMLNMPGKERRRGGIVGWKPGFKKAIVSLKKGEKIEVQ